MAVPYTFGNATTSIPLSQLDTNFATAITIGNTAVYLGNTTTTFGNVTLNNVTINSGNSTVSSESISGNLTFTGTGNRILGDFSNATVASRVSFQDSTTNNGTYIQTLPNGTSQGSGVIVFNNSTPTNAAYMALTADATTAQVNSSITGTGTYLPMTFRTGGSERMRIDTSGNVGIGTASPSNLLQVDKSQNASTIASVINTNVGASASAYFKATSNDGNLYAIAQGAGGGGGGTIYWDGTNSLFLKTFGAYPLNFGTSNTERMRIDSSGNVGIGTTNINAKFVVSNAGAAGLEIAPTGFSSAPSIVSYNRSGAAYTQLTLDASVNVFAISGTEKARIDSSGNLLVGTTAVTAYETNTRLKLNTSGTSQVFNQLQLVNSGSPAAVGDIVGIGFAAGETTAYGVKGSIGYVRTADYGRGAITFYTNNTAGTASVSTSDERMRIDSSGNLLVGTTSVTGLVTSSQSSASLPSVAARATSTSFANDVLQIYCARDTNTSAYNYILAQRPAGVSFVVRDSGNVQNANNSYGALSDVRIKENVIDATPKLADLMKVKVRNFNYINDAEKTKQIGVIAQELETVFPSLVDEDSEGTKGVKYSVFVPMLIKAIQELKAELDALKGTK